MDKTINQKAWFLVLPVFLVVAFSAILPLMTVVQGTARSLDRSRQPLLRLALA
jgi:hypothetical protein